MPIYLVVTPFFPSPTSWRGAYCLDFVRALQREVEVEGGGGEWSVLVFVPGAGKDYEIEGVKVHRFPTKHLPSNILPLLFRRYNERSFIKKVKEVLNSTVQPSTFNLQPQTLTVVKVCHAHTANYAIYALAAKRTFGCTALLHHHDLQSFGLNLGVLRHCALYNAWLFCRMRKLFEQIDCHVFISEKCRESFLKAPDASWTIYEDYKRQMRGPAFFHCRPVRIKRSLILRNGVDTAIFNRKLRVVGCEVASCEVAGECPPCDRRAMAEKKVEEWLEGVDDETFAAALEKIVGEKVAAGEYRFERQDDIGKANANMTEVAFEANTKRGQKKLPQLVSLTEAIRTVVSHQTATGTNPPDTSNIANPSSPRKGDNESSALHLHLPPTPALPHPQPFQQSQPPQHRVFTIGCIGNFIDLKDQETLIRAVGLLSEKQSALHLHLPSTPIKVVFVGSGPTLESCKRLAAETEAKVNNSIVGLGLPPWPKLSFDFRSEVSHSQLADFYRSLDLFVLPSYFEGFGCVLTEAWSCGTPFLTCLGQGADDIIYAEDRGMWLFRPQDATGLMNCIENYFRHRHCQRLSRPVAIDELVRAFVKELANG